MLSREERRRYRNSIYKRTTDNRLRKLLCELPHRRQTTMNKILEVAKVISNMNDGVNLNMVKTAMKLITDVIDDEIDKTRHVEKFCTEMIKI